jgi:hypothetical protein
MTRLDEDRIELLRRWGDGLERDGREEMRAAGRAILLLIEEIERLHVDLWNERSLEPSAAAAPPPADVIEPDVQSSLGARLRQLSRRRPETTST